jgi:putative addiction module killer protein
MYEVLQTPEFFEWTQTLDASIANRVDNVLDRMEQGNWGDYKPIAGVPGIFERRLLGSGPGIRLYFCRRGSRLIILLTGGDKSTQQRSDIRQALRLSRLYP